MTGEGGALLQESFLLGQPLTMSIHPKLLMLVYTSQEV
jgi:hypothetical protein